VPFITPYNAGDLVAGQTFGQGLDHRDAAGDGRLEADDAAGLFGGRGERLPVMGKHRLVGRHHVLARGDGGLCGGLGRAIRAAHQLDEDIHIVTPRKGYGIILPRVVRDRHTAILVAGAGRDGADGDRTPGARRQQFGLLLDDSHDTCADGAQTGYADAQGGGHCGLRSSLCRG